MSAKRDTWMPLYVGDYLRDTSRLTTEEHGAYLLLIMDYWVNGPLPDDDARLAAVARMPLVRWKKIMATIRGFFAPQDGQLRHKRIDQEIANSAGLVERRREAGRAGGLAARGKSGRPAENGNENSKGNSTAINSGSGEIANELQKNTPSPSSSPSQKDSSLRSEAAGPPDHAATAVDDWNALASELHLPAVQRLSKTRETKLKARLKDAGGIDGWRAALAAIRRNEWMHGRNPRGWKANFDFVLQESSFIKLMEGAYDNTPGAQHRNGFAQLIAEGYFGDPDADQLFQ